MKRKHIAYPYILWAVLFTLVPMLLILYYGLTVSTPDGVQFSTENFIKFFTSPNSLLVLWRSLKAAFISTLICLLLGYPMALFLSNSTFKNKSILITLLVVPMWMSLLLRTYAWLTLLENTGLINSVLTKFNLPTIQFLYNENSIIFGMVYNFLPFMVLPINSTLSKMDNRIIEAAQDLGASPAKVFAKVIFPLSLPGVMSGITMVFMPAVTTFAISSILSGRKIDLIGNLIENQFVRNNDWHYGSALSLILIAIILITMAFAAKVDKDDGGGGLF